MKFHLNCVYQVLVLRERFAERDLDCSLASEEPKSGAVKSVEVECFLSARNRKHSHSLNSATRNAVETCADDTYPFAVRKCWGRNDPEALTRKTPPQGDSFLQSGIVFTSQVPFMAANLIGVRRCSSTVSSGAVAWYDGVTTSLVVEATAR